ncbi:uncharacterized protein N7498_008114 [Penicillium cinerascens]|uniref:Uncharacterized protein n=1 Tax=Penicillium cinerascens TaxID=70096 RepID=A0A9W9JER7_9EURO|nr:uncharacterized protein N7498_008114 [Penicillium cinerascens]KAJ5194676.1 hypothetical protein N7498_008114 [Penicillium cinerascens]
MLATLPSELLDMVVGQSFHIYIGLLSYPHPELSLDDLVVGLERLPWKYLKYTQELGFSVPIHERVESRCVHHGGNERFSDEAVQGGLAEFLTDDENMDEDTDQGMNKSRIVDPLCNLSSALGSLRFPDDQLRSFRWEVGTCIPEALFCGNESFFGNQRQVQSITLITDGECGATKNVQDFVDLVQFRELRSLDWRGLNQYNDFESVRECIKVHGHQIQSLTLDLLTWVRAEKIWADGFRQRTPQRTRIPDNFFSQKVLNVHPRDQNVIFVSLENLQLSAVSFYHTGIEMAYAYNIESLKTLKLRNCPGSLDWLRMILDSVKPMKLRSLKLTVGLNSLDRDAYMHITDTTCNFIHHNSGLESLYLMLREPIDWNTLTVVCHVIVISSTW